MRSLIPTDSSWKTAEVFPDARSSKTFGSSSLMEWMSIGSRSENERNLLISLTALSITVKVLRPRKSNFTKPIVSTSSLSY